MGLIENLRLDRVSGMHLRSPVVVPRGTTVRETIEAMRAGRLGCAIVVDEAGRPVGMFTEGQLRELLPRTTGLLDDVVDRHMADRFPTVSTTDAVEIVLDAMQTNNTRFVCVRDAEGRVAGLTGQKGLMEYVAEHFPREVMVQRVGSAAYPRKREGA